jgi:putative tryptophan/tyrosine transport system substrate-binding protein
VLLNPADAASAKGTLKTVKEAAHALGLEMLFLNASTPAEIDAAFVALARERAEALFIAGSAFFTGRAVQLATLAVRDRIPASYAAREMVEAGLLMSYGTPFVDTWRQTGIYAGSILKGAKPADLPVLQRVWVCSAFPITLASLVRPATRHLMQAISKGTSMPTVRSRRA